MRSRRRRHPPKTSCSEEPRRGGKPKRTRSGLPNCKSVSLRALLRRCLCRLSLLLRLLDLGLLLALLLRIRKRSRGDRASRFRLLQRLDLVQQDKLLLLDRELLLGDRQQCRIGHDRLRRRKLRRESEGDPGCKDGFSYHSVPAFFSSPRIAARPALKVGSANGACGLVRPL